MDILADPISDSTAEIAVGLQFHLQSIANQSLPFLDDLSHALEAHRRLTRSEESDRGLWRPGKEFLHPSDGEFQIDGSVAGLNRLTPMRNVAVRAIQVAGTGHEKTHAVFSKMSHTLLPEQSAAYEEGEGRAVMPKAIAITSSTNNLDEHDRNHSAFASHLLLVRTLTTCKPHTSLASQLAVHYAIACRLWIGNCALRCLH